MPYLQNDAPENYINAVMFNVSINYIYVCCFVIDICAKPTNPLKI